ncbi:type VII secretion integral membrane protein EccD [Embleya sp. NBC_00896]|uniref:type VII secretion integral membrane protein EccD n=1 Tax=Embleya sp. NBC_00896 TaxID=2975961 RepID=UPI00386388D7|nr:type VII secretion integral membrane protein EccD [Embleya sp. NBC_00896]
MNSTTTTVTTGFARITVIAPDCRVDLALPEEVPLAELYPEILRLSGQVQRNGAVTGFQLTRLDGEALDSTLTLAAQNVRDGELLRFTALADAPPPPVYDDVADSVATSVAGEHRLWTPEMLRIAGLSGAAVFFSLGAIVLWRMTPLPHGLPAIVAGSLALVLTVVAGVRARVYGDNTGGAVLGLGALPNAFIAGLGIVEPPVREGPGRVQFLVACVAVLVVSTLIAALLPERGAVYIAGAGAGALGTLATFGLIAFDSGPREAAAVAATVAVAMIAFLPSWAARLARLPIGFLPSDAPNRQGDTLDHADVAARARNGHELLSGLTGACAAAIVASCVVLGNVDTLWTQILTAVVSLVTLGRARLFRHTAQVTVLYTAGLLGLAMLFIGLALDTGFLDKERQGWIFALVCVIGALLSIVATTVPVRGLSPFWGRLMDVLEGMLMVSVVPLCLAVLDLYDKLRNITA